MSRCSSVWNSATNAAYCRDNNSVALDIMRSTSRDIVASVLKARKDGRLPSSPPSTIVAASPKVQPQPYRDKDEPTELWDETVIFANACWELADAGNRTAVNILRAACRHITDRCGAELQWHDLPEQLITQKELGEVYRLQELSEDLNQAHSVRVDAYRRLRELTPPLENKLKAEVPIEEGDEGPFRAWLYEGKLCVGQSKGYLSAPENRWIVETIERSFREGKSSRLCWEVLWEAIKKRREQTREPVPYIGPDTVWAYLRRAFKGQIKGGRFSPLPGKEIQ